jgi:hypothetical protein
MTITDQTDASNLAGNMTVVTGSKSQVYLTGTTQPFSPDWKIQHLVLRPYMIATNIYRGQDLTKYNPDLFDPWEYPDLNNPGDTNVYTGYIKDIKWYIKDTAGNETLINPATDTRFSYQHTYTRQSGDPLQRVINDSRQLVIKDNILLKDNAISIIVKFSFLDPFADIYVPVAYSVDINCLSTGVGHSKTSIESVNGTSLYNAEPDKLMLIGEYYSEGQEQDLDATLADPLSRLNTKWYIRTANKTGWSLLDPSTQDTNPWNVPGEDKAYEIHRITNYNVTTGVYTTEKTYNLRGGTVLYAYKGLIAGSDIIKFSVQDDTLDGQTFNSLETVYDYSDPTRCYIHSTNGDKLFKGMQGLGTVIKAVITYNGKLLDDTAIEYGTSKDDVDRLFDFYWYKIEADGNTVYNIYMDTDVNGNPVLSEKNTNDADYLAINGWPKRSDRSLTIKPDNITNKATFSVDILNRYEQAKDSSRTSLLNSLVTEDEITEAIAINQGSGIDKLDIEATMETAYELHALANQ